MAEVVSLMEAVLPLIEEYESCNAPTHAVCCVSQRGAMTLSR